MLNISRDKKIVYALNLGIFRTVHLFSKVQHLQGVITFLITRNVKTVEISRSDVDRYNSSFSIRMANFETLTELCTARKEECPQILLH